MTACSRGPSAAPSAGTATSPSELVAAGHEVTYLTRLQWDEDDPPRIPGVEVVAVSPREPLYGDDGNRRDRAAAARSGGASSSTCCAGGAATTSSTRARSRSSRCSRRARRSRARGRSWAWTGSRSGRRSYWQSYLGRAGGTIGHLVQRACAVLSPRAFVFSRLHARRLAEEGLRGEPRHAGRAVRRADGGPAVGRAAEPLVVFAGRHIAEKRVPSIPAAIAAARERVPGLRARVFGDGPQRAQLLAEIDRLGLAGGRRGPGVRRRLGRRRGAPGGELPAPAVQPRGLRARRDRGGVGGNAERGRPRAGQRRDGADRRGRQRIRGCDALG